MARKKRKWPKYTAMALGGAIMVGSLSLVLVDKIAPEQEYIPKSIAQFPSKAIAAVLQPLQRGFSGITSYAKNYLETWKLFKNIEIEYNNLKSQNDDLIYQAMYVSTLEEENEQLKRMMNVYQENVSQNPVYATVIAKETSNWFQKFTIDVGAKQGIAEYMAVVNADGLIGYIDTVHETSSEVITIIDSRAGVAALIESSRDQGSVRGTLGIADEPTCRMYYLPIDTVPRPGDVVVTSGIGMSFPKGIKIGEIRESTRGVEDNKRYVVIEPYVDFEHIENVLVLVVKPDVETLLSADDGQIDYTPVTLDTPRPYLGYGEGIDDPNLGAVTAPPRATRSGSEYVDPESTVAPDATATPGDENFTLAPGATPTPDPELDALMREEFERDALYEEGNP